ncbi:hypothetical protein ANN_11354 [Periplaneta americana]|uniref:Uncharacterized protein n=1 Tax=Periplaneta americana TaxID=6978 RepID=A0ABQ8T6C0_PERAM|nr:hypothetical protein ANN_11354 [Periplaneta americana]
MNWTSERAGDGLFGLRASRASPIDVRYVRSQNNVRGVYYNSAKFDFTDLKDAEKLTCTFGKLYLLNCELSYSYELEENSNRVPTTFLSELPPKGACAVKVILRSQYTVRKTCGKVYSIIHVLKRINVHLPSYLKKSLVQTLAFPYFDYADILLTDLSSDNKMKLQRAHNLCPCQESGIRYPASIRDCRNKIEFKRKLTRHLTVYYTLHNEYVRLDSSVSHQNPDPCYFVSDLSGKTEDVECCLLRIAVFGRNVTDQVKFSAERNTMKSSTPAQLRTVNCPKTGLNLTSNTNKVSVMRESEERQIRRFKLVTAIFVIAHIAFIPTHD